MKTPMATGAWTAIRYLSMGSTLSARSSTAAVGSGCSIPPTYSSTATPTKTIGPTAIRRSGFQASVWKTRTVSPIRCAGVLTDGSMEPRAAQ